MPTEIVKYCLVTLLSQDADAKMAEMDALLNQPFEQTAFAACLSANGETLSLDTSATELKNDSDEEEVITTMFWGGGGGRPSRE